MHKLYILNFRILQSSIVNVQIRREFCWESAVKRIVKIGLHPRSYDQKSKSLFFYWNTVYIKQVSLQQMAALLLPPAE